MPFPNPQILVNGSTEQDATGARKELDGIYGVFMAAKNFEDASRV